MKRDKVIYLIELFKRQLTLVYGVHTATTKINGANSASGVSRGSLARLFQ